ncbi:MAG TPA: exodeoxyribonuclease VII small subunit [Candidatus Paceibacterota bacterium]|nr:exodeoxyribonuclease VII small subunit [Candidatus Paceibacterota bacterium]
MSKKEKDFNLSKALKDLKSLVNWFEDQDQVDVEEGLKKVKEGAELVKESKKRLKEIENEFEEVKKDIESN